MITPGSSDAAAVIIDLHLQIVNSARRSLETAIEIGKLLVQRKDQEEHGQWGNWVATHLPFTSRTASNYMRLFRMRHQIKSETLSDLASAYKLIVGPAPMDRSEAESVSAQIQNDLQSLAADTVAFVDELRRIRDQGGFAPEYPTFEAYLLHLSLTTEDFGAKEELCDAIQAWMSGGLAAPVFKCLWQQRKDKAEERNEDA